MDDDRLSILPDAILCHILSFLPTKEAVATSVLSKSWTPLWRSVPTLDIHNLDYTRSQESYARFVRSVDAVIHARGIDQPMQKCRLHCVSSGYSDIADVHTWLDAVAQRRVQHLELIFGVPSKPFTSPVVFRCTTLVVLKMWVVSLGPLSSVDLPLLKVLLLQHVVFSDGGSLAELLSGCPVLEDFKARDVRFPNYFNIKEFKTLPKLTRADIAIYDKLMLMKKAVKNVQFLRLNGINWQRLDEGQGTEDPDFFPMFHNLTRLELFYRDFNDEWYQVVELLQYCPKLQVLLINQPPSGGAFDGMQQLGHWRYPKSVPECILLHLKSCYLNGYAGTKGEFQFARYIIQNGRFLKRMAICSDSTVNQKGKHQNSKKVSSCMTHSASATCQLSFE